MSSAEAADCVKVGESVAPGPTAARLAPLVKEHFAFIWRLLRRLGLGPDDADDAAQQVFLIAVERIAGIAHGSERSFLFGTALRVASTRRRHRARERTADDLDPSDIVPLADELTSQKRLRELLDGILGRMEEDMRIVFALVEVEGLTVPESAELLGVPTGTVASRLRRGREHFAAAVRRIEAGLVRGGLR